MLECVQLLRSVIGLLKLRSEAAEWWERCWSARITKETFAMICDAEDRPAVLPLKVCGLAGALVSGFYKSDSSSYLVGVRA